MRRTLLSRRATPPTTSPGTYLHGDEKRSQVNVSSGLKAAQDKNAPPRQPSLDVAAGPKTSTSIKQLVNKKPWRDPNTLPKVLLGSVECGRGLNRLHSTKALAQINSQMDFCRDFLTYSAKWKLTFSSISPGKAPTHHVSACSLILSSCSEVLPLTRCPALSFSGYYNRLYYKDAAISTPQSANRDCCCKPQRLVFIFNPYIYIRAVFQH